MFSAQPSPARRPATLVLLLTVLACLAVACASRDPVEVAGGKLEASTLPVTGQEGTVDLRVYLRAGAGPHAHLQAVTRRVVIAPDLPRRALELLIAGPSGEEGQDLRVTLPQRTVVQAFAVEGDTAVVDLSAHASGDAAGVEPTPEHELLALAAVANTLTEFPEIDRVRLTVDGGRVLWGNWPIPEPLGRDEQAVGPRPETDPLPTPDRFRVAAQRIGSADAQAVVVHGVRAVDRLGFVRFVIELADPAGETDASGVPPTTAGIEGDRLVLQIEDVLSSAAEPAPGAGALLENLPFTAIETDSGELPGVARFAIAAGGRPFWLHTLSSPTRVVLDVRK